MQLANDTSLCAPILKSLLKIHGREIKEQTKSANAQEIIISGNIDTHQSAADKAGENQKKHST